MPHFSGQLAFLVLGSFPLVLDFRIIVFKHESHDLIVIRVGVMESCVALFIAFHQKILIEVALRLTFYSVPETE